MNDKLLADLQDRLQRIEQRGARLRIGVVTDDSPLTVALGGVDADGYYTDVKTIATGLAADDKVAVLMAGNDLLVLGVVR